jgi:hypothetical protein
VCKLPYLRVTRFHHLALISFPLSTTKLSGVCTTTVLQRVVGAQSRLNKPVEKSTVDETMAPVVLGAVKLKTNEIAILVVLNPANALSVRTAVEAAGIVGRLSAACKGRRPKL